MERKSKNYLLSEYSFLVDDVKYKLIAKLHSLPGYYCLVVNGKVRVKSDNFDVFMNRVYKRYDKINRQIANNLVSYMAVN